MTDPSNTSESIEFVQYHQPALPDGSYEIVLTQTLKTTDSSKIPESVFSATRRFVVAGERCGLDADAIVGVFPPEGSLGDHAQVLPHVLLKRSTLPWERSADASGERLPWLALLLLDGDERFGGTIEKAAFIHSYGADDGATVWQQLLDPQVGWLRAIGGNTDHAAVLAKTSRVTPHLNAALAIKEPQIETILDQMRAPQVLPLSELQSPTTSGLIWPGLVLEAGQQPDDRATVIDVDQALLATLLPSRAELECLAHVRRLAGADDELAVVIGNRLPKPGAISTVHLVSVEQRYNAAGFDMGAARAGDLVRLISLKSWSFACVSANHSFAGLIGNLNREPATLRLPVRPLPNAERYLSRGCMPLAHGLRQGDTTASWYHGPLVPGEQSGEVSLPVRVADQLVRFDPTIGLFDVSYAAAWELGRLLTLQNRRVSTSLYAWKRTDAQQRSQAAQQTRDAHLPIQRQPIAVAEPPAEVVAWFAGLAQLQGVPFSYLVADEHLLPSESIRFCWLDRRWMACLADGALSVGRVTATDLQRDQLLAARLPQSSATPVNGFLLRSDVVAGWPGLLAAAFDQAGQPLESLRIARLSSHVLLCLFAGTVASGSLSLKPTTLHFGFDAPHDSTGSLFKTLRAPQGQTADAGVVSVPWRPAAQRVVDIAQLANAMQARLNVASFTSAQFARQMIEAAEKIVFASHIH